jgi:hypothetical protein
VAKIFENLVTREIFWSQEKIGLYFLGNVMAHASA